MIKVACSRALYLHLIVDSGSATCITVLIAFSNAPIKFNFGANKQFISDNASAYISSCY